MQFAKFGSMPDEQREPKQDHRETKPAENKTEHRAPTRRSYVTEDRENPLICRGID
jgi:hypothetical protein